MADKERVDLLKQVYSKSEYTKIIDTQFKSLGVESIPDQLNNAPTVANFFSQYNLLFYDIPAEGEVNSHQYLVETSGEYIDYQANNEEIQALLEEIAELREENLEVRQEIADVIADINP